MVDLRGEAIFSRAAINSSRITSRRRMREPMISRSSVILLGNFGQFGLDLLALQAGQAGQAQFQNAACLRLRQAHGVIVEIVLPTSSTNASSGAHFPPASGVPSAPHAPHWNPGCRE